MANYGLKGPKSSLRLRLVVSCGRSHLSPMFRGHVSYRCIHVDHRARLSNVWIPRPGIRQADVKRKEEAHEKLNRAGYLHQAHSGVFQMLPLGLRVQEKLEKIVEKHMQSLGASKLSLSTISSEALWEESGRLNKVSGELFRFQDRRDTRYILSPTHEEEITTLVAQTTQSYKRLPVRLYQMTRKYRDEFRPRHGLLRAREFIMKDLYTFDYSVPHALETYEQVRAVYDKIFAELKLPVLVAQASSGDMGGNLSHEYHLPAVIGEDHVISCDTCDYVTNVEVAEAGKPVAMTEQELPEVSVWRGVSKDRTKLVNVWYPGTAADPTTGESRTYEAEDVNIYAIKDIVPDLDAGVKDYLPFWSAAFEGSAQQPESGSGAPRQPVVIINIVDGRLPPSVLQRLQDNADGNSLPIVPPKIAKQLRDELRPLSTIASPVDHPSLPWNFLNIKTGDGCTRCASGTLKVQRAIELGHTFHLGTRYSELLAANVTVPASVLFPEASEQQEDRGSSKNPSGDKTVIVPMQMGCHGIGISRIIAAVADHLSDARGLNWPRAIAPYEVAVIAGTSDRDAADAAAVYDALAASTASGSSSDGHRRPLDVVLDDRGENLPYKMTDADLHGYPVLVILGRAWRGGGARCEVQCRRLGVKEDVPLAKLPGRVRELMDQL